MSQESGDGDRAISRRETNGYSSQKWLALHEWLEKRPLNSSTPSQSQVKGKDARGLILQCTGNEKLFSVLFHFVFGCPSTLLSRKETCHLCIDKYLLTCTSEALFSLRKILDFATVALSFVYGKYYPIID